MGYLSTIFTASSKSLSYVLGGSVILLACSAMIMSWQADRIIVWVLDIFGISFTLILGFLVGATVFCSVRLREVPSAAEKTFWHLTGQHAANGIATLALTYTLLGISLGIGTLSEQDLSPSTINKVIKTLTEHFSLAFLTTVFGLPIAGIMRAFISIVAFHPNQREKIEVTGEAL